MLLFPRVDIFSNSIKRKIEVEEIISFFGNHFVWSTQIRLHVFVYPTKSIFQGEKCVGIFYKPDVIYLAEDVTDDVFDNALFHELVHFHRHLTKTEKPDIKGREYKYQPEEIAARIMANVLVRKFNN